MKRRLVATLVRSRLADWPAVAVVGPRQCGKTTLAHLLSSFYFDLEQTEDRKHIGGQASRVLVTDLEHLLAAV